MGVANTAAKVIAAHPSNNITVQDHQILTHLSRYLDLLLNQLCNEIIIDHNTLPPQSHAMH